MSWFRRQIRRYMKRICPKDKALPLGTDPLDPNIRGTFRKFESPWEGSGFDENALYTWIPRVRSSFENDRSFLGLFARSVRLGTIVCHQYIWVWDNQLFPVAHPMDYAPVMILTGLGDSVPNLMYYDIVHYEKMYQDFSSDEFCTLWLNPVWKSFAFAKTRPAHDRRTALSSTRPLPEEASIAPLYDAYLERWWWGEKGDGVLSDWYGDPDDQAPHLKIDDQLLNPLTLFHPRYPRFDTRVNPGKSRVSTLEQSAMKAKYLFVISAQKSETLSDCLQSMKELTLDIRKEAQGWNKADHMFVGFLSYVTLLGIHGLIDFPVPSPYPLDDIFRPFLKYWARRSVTRPSGLISSIKHQTSIIKSVEELKFDSLVEEKGNDRQYFKEVKSAIDNEEKIGSDVLLREIESWYRSASKNLTKKGQKTLYDALSDDIKSDYLEDVSL